MTAEQRFRAIVAPFRLRVAADAEGFPVAVGRYGQLEWHEPGVLAVYSQTPRMLAKLLVLGRGVRRHQIGDVEFRLLFPVDKGHDTGALKPIASLVRIRTRRVLSERQKQVLLHGRRPFQGAS